MESDNVLESPTKSISSIIESELIVMPEFQRKLLSFIFETQIKNQSLRFNDKIHVNRPLLVKHFNTARTTVYDNLYELMELNIIEKYSFHYHRGSGRPQTYFKVKPKKLYLVARFLNFKLEDKVDYT